MLTAPLPEGEPFASQVGYHAFRSGDSSRLWALGAILGLSSAPVRAGTSEAEGQRSFSLVDAQDLVIDDGTPAWMVYRALRCSGVRRSFGRPSVAGRITRRSQG